MEKQAVQILYKNFDLCDSLCNPDTKRVCRPYTARARVAGICRNQLHSLK
jgi:hypothetical protein